jgi:hypothetical protein
MSLQWQETLKKYRRELGELIALSFSCAPMLTVRHDPVDLQGRNLKVGTRVAINRTGRLPFAAQ